MLRYKKYEIRTSNHEQGTRKDEFKSIPCFQTEHEDLRFLPFDGVYPAVDSSTPLRVTAGRAQDENF